MAEQERKLEVYEVRFFCDKAGEDGEMCGGQVLPITKPSNPPHQHECGVCGEKYKFEEIYPEIRFK